jgi:cysteine desulfurase/selenocysteine lyase
VSAAGPASAPAAPRAARPLDAAALAEVRAQFPILARTVRGKPLVYLDNAATTQKPVAVLDAVRRYYETCNANVHRGVHRLSEEATVAYEAARERVRAFVNAASTREVVFVRGTTEALNLVAGSVGRARVGAGDEVVVSAMEHHSNIVPWQMLCRERGARLRVAPIDDRGEIDLGALERLLTPRTRVVSIGHASNALGTVNPVRAVADLAHAAGAVVVVDGAQAVPHLPVDVRALDCDFYAFSAHKAYGPMGIGALYGREALLDATPPWQGGGDMIKSVTFEETTWNDLPFKFEAGTPNVGGAIGMAAAFDWMESVGRERIAAHERALLERGTRLLSAVPGLRLVGTAREKVGVLSFVVEGVHPHDLGTVLDADGVAIRTGHHCAQPVMARYGLPATARASFAAYNAPEEVDALVEALGRARRLFGLP